MIGPSLSITGGQRSGFGIAKTKPDLWLDAGRGVGTTGARLFTAANKEYFELASELNPGTQNFWVSFWMKPAAVTAATYWTELYTGSGSDSVPGFWITRNATAMRVAFSTSDVVTQHLTGFSDFVFAVGTWSHVAILFDRVAGTITGYKNGVASATVGNISAYAGNCSPGGAASRIGAYSSTAMQEDGSLSRIAYGQGTLPTADEIAELYNQGNGKFYAELSPALEAKVTHYWNLNEAYGPAYDAKGTNDGAVTCGELVANGGFETWTTATDVASWTEGLAGLSTVNQEATIKDAGSYSCRLDIVGADIALVSQSILSVGRTYDVSVRHRGSAGTESMIIGDGAGTWSSFACSTSFATKTLSSAAVHADLILKRSGGISPYSIYIDTVSCKQSTTAATTLPATAGPREATASDSVGGYHGVLTNMDTVNAWSTDTPDGSYTATKQDSIGTAHGTMTGFTDIDLAHVDGPDGAWGPAIPDETGSFPDGWLVSSVKDSRSTSVPSSLNVRAWDEAYTEPTATGSRWLTRASAQRFAMTTHPAYGTGNFTIEAWIYPLSAGTGEFPISTGGTIAGVPGACIYRAGGTGALQLQLSAIAEPLVTVTSPVALTPYKWTHFIATVDRTANMAYLWQDGTLVASGSTATVTGSATGNAVGRCIGGQSHDSTSYTFDGAISRVRIAIGAAYTTADVAEAYNGGKGRVFTDYSAGLATKVTYAWELNEATEVDATCIKGSNTATQAGTDATIATAASVYLPAYDATLTGFTTSPRSASDVPTCLVGKCKSIALNAAGYAPTGARTLTGMGARSVSFWFKRNGNPAGTERILTEAISTTPGFSATITYTGILQCLIAESGAIIANVGKAAVCDNQWHHAVVTWDGTTTADKVILYFDNAANVATATKATQGGASSYNFQIGGYNGANSIMVGSVCRPQIFAGRALTADEVATLYAGGDVTEGHTAEWRFNESDAITVPFTHSLECDGANTKVDCGNQVVGSSDATVSAWIYPDNAGEGGYGRIFDNTTAELYLAGTLLGGRFNMDATAPTTLSGSLPYATWSHIAIQRSGSHVEFFVNGKLQPITLIQTANGGTPAAGAGNLIIGNKSDSSRTFDGRIGQVRVDRAVLTQTQIRQLAQGGSPAAPFASWKFDTPLDLPSLSGCKAIRFDGVDDAITCGDVLDAGTSDFTIMAWCKTASAVATTPTILGKYNAATGDYRLRIASGAASFVFLTTAGTYVTSPTIAVNDKCWHHIAATVSRAGSATLYLDGVSVGTVAVSGAVAENLNNASTFRIGNINDGTTAWDGEIADARHYYACLTQSQIRSIISGSDYTTGMTARWKFGETPRSIASCAGGYSLKFDGTDDYVKTGTVNRNYVEYAISAWIKPVTNFTDWVFTHAATGWTRMMRINSGGVLEGFCTAATTHANSVSAANAVKIGVWQHVVARYSSSGVVGQAKKIHLFVDGVECSYSTQTASVGTEVDTSTLPVYIGSDGTTYLFDGRIDDVRYYAAALSDSDIALLSQGGEPATAPTARWKFDDGPQFGEPSNGDPISVWESREGKAWNFGQITASARPTYVQSGQNGKPGLGFLASSSQYLKLPQNALTGTSGTLLFVIKQVDTSADYAVIASADEALTTKYIVAWNKATGIVGIAKNDATASNDIRSGAVLTTAAAIVAIRSSGSIADARVNGASVAFTATSGTNDGSWFGDIPDRDNTTVGALVRSSSQYHMNGVIYEIIAYDRALSDAELRKVERKLATKYGITI